MREELLYALAMPDHERAMYVYLHGFPSEDKRQPVTPLEGVSHDVARSLLKLTTAKIFSRGEWAKSKLWTQLREGDARARLEKTAEEYSFALSRCAPVSG